METVKIGKTLGLIEVPVGSYRESMVKFHGNPRDLFYMAVFDMKGVPPDEIAKALPKIEPSISRFDIRVMNVRGKVLMSRTVLVTEVIAYEFHEDDGTLTLEFNCVTLFDNLDPAVIPPIIAHIFVKGDFIGIVYEGDPETSIVYSTNEHIIFRHGSSVYYRHKVLAITHHVGTDSAGNRQYERLFICTVSSKSPLEPGEEELDEFRKEFEKFLNLVYHHDKGRIYLS